jgi:hypothetical protein
VFVGLGLETTSGRQGPIWIGPPDILKLLISSSNSGDGEGILTLDPNLGKQIITLSRYSIKISQISFQYTRVRVLPVFVGLAGCKRNDTLLSWRGLERNNEMVTAR